MPPRRAPKRDKNEREIIDFLEINGCSVVQLDGAGVPDLAVGFAGQTYLLEVKNGKQGKLTSDQQLFFKHWVGHAIVVRTLEDVKLFIKSININKPIKKDYPLWTYLPYSIPGFTIPILV